MREGRQEEDGNVLEIGPWKRSLTHALQFKQALPKEDFAWNAANVHRQGRLAHWILIVEETAVQCEERAAA